MNSRVEVEAPPDWMPDHLKGEWSLEPRVGQKGPITTYVENIPPYYWWLSTASSAASLYHGYRRNNSLGWGLVWGLLGAMFPVVTPVVAVAQGFGKRA